MASTVDRPSPPSSGRASAPAPPQPYISWPQPAVKTVAAARLPQCSDGHDEAARRVLVTAANLEGHLVKAIVYDVVGAPALVREVAEPDCPEDGAVITVRATGVCRSDWHAWRGHEAVPLPHIPGHEFAGVIAAVGAQVRGFAPGDRVTAPFVNGCGRCDWCRAGDAQICPDQTQPGFSHPGSFAERVVVRVADVNLVRLPNELDFVSLKTGWWCSAAVASGFRRS